MLVTKLQESGVISRRVFTFFLGINTTTVVHRSKLWIGAYIGPTNYTFSWIPIQPKTPHWKVNLGVVTVGST